MKPWGRFSLSVLSKKLSGELKDAKTYINREQKYSLPSVYLSFYECGDAHEEHYRKHKRDLDHQRRIIAHEEFLTGHIEG